MNRRQKEAHLPGWLWFFLILPAFLGVALLWRRRDRLSRLLRMPRYTEPKSIPLSDAADYLVEAEELPPAAGQAEDVELLGEVELRGAVIIEEAPPAASQAAEDDLKIIEGIGPSIAGLLKASGITTFRQLAGTPVARLNEILTQARLSHLADPGTWPEQAYLADAGQWTELENFQRSLKGGRRKKAG